MTGQARGADTLIDELTAWAEGPGVAKARNLINKKAMYWLEPEELARYAVGRVWERAQDGEPLRSPVGYAVSNLTHFASELARGKPRRKTDQAREPERDGRELHRRTQVRSEDGGAPDFDSVCRRDGVEALGSAFAMAEVRRCIGEWLPAAKRLGDRDGRFGDPATNGAALLYLVMFSERPLNDRFWPAGYPFNSSSLSDSELNLRVALWLADRSWFPASFDPEEDATMRQRRRRARDRLAKRWVELGMSDTAGQP